MAFALLETMRKQDAVYWDFERDASGRAKTDRGGKKIWAAPQEIKVFWIDLQELYLNDDGQTKTSRSKIFVGLPIYRGARIFEGVLNDIPATLRALPEQVPNAYSIEAVRRAPTFTPGEFVRVAFL